MHFSPDSSFEISPELPTEISPLNSTRNVGQQKKNKFSKRQVVLLDDHFIVQELSASESFSSRPLRSSKSVIENKTLATHRLFT